MALTVFGEVTKTIFLKQIQAHKLHQEFAVATGNAVKKGQAVKLNTAGEIVPAIAGELMGKVIGYSVHDAAAEELATIGMRAFTIVWAQSAGALDAGPVKIGAAGADPIYATYVATALETDVVGWALDSAAGADEMIRVALT